MFYLVRLFLILSLVLYLFLGADLNKNPYHYVLDYAKNQLDFAKAKIGNFVFPKTKKEILIENLESDYNFLNRFFDDTAPNMLKSKDISEKDKNTINEAVTQFGHLKTTIDQIKTEEKKDKSIFKTLVDKVFKKEIPSTQIEPTSIPPQCRLEC